MADTVKDLPHKIKDEIELQIRDVFKLEGFNRQKALNVLRIPSMTINKMLVFENCVPDKEDLLDVMHEFLLGKVESE